MFFENFLKKIKKVLKCYRMLHSICDIMYVVKADKFFIFSPFVVYILFCERRRVYRRFSRGDKTGE